MSALRLKSKFASDLWTGIRTGPARAGLAFFSLMLGLFAVTILLATFDALKQQADELVQSFGAGSFVLVSSAVTPEGPPWTRHQGRYFRENLGHEAWVSGVKELERPAGVAFSVGTTDAFLARARGWQFVQGRALDQLDVRQGARHAMAPASLCRQEQWKLGEIISLGHDPFQLVGILQDGSQSAPGIPQDMVWIPYTADALETGDADALARVDAWVFRATEGVSPEALRHQVARLLEQPGLNAEDVEWITPESLLQGIRRWQRAIAWTAGTGGALGLLLGAVTLAGMLLTGVRERVSEIGLRRALGARRHEVAALFVAEALVLTGAAALVGAGAAEATLHALGSRFPLPFHFGLTARLLPLLLACGLALICSIGPALLAARLPPAEALRND